MTSYVLNAHDRLKRRLSNLRDCSPSTADAPSPMPAETSSGSKMLPGSVKLHHCIPENLGPIGEHIVWSVIKAIQRGDDVLVITNSYDGKDTLRLTLPARKVA